MRGKGKQFLPGRSGNPGGRPRGLAEFRESAQKFTAEGLKILIGLARKDPDSRVRALAVREIFDRGWGKPPQAITGPEGGPLQVNAVATISLGALSDDELGLLSKVIGKLESTETPAKPEGIGE